MADDRAVAPVVGKAVEIGLVLLFVGVVTSALFNGVVPRYRTAAGDAVADRTAIAVAQRIQQAAAPNATAVRARRRVRLARTIRGRPYDVVVRNRTVVVDHPHPAVAASAGLALPPSVVSVRGRWHSTGRTVVVVRSVPGGLAVRLGEEGAS